MKKINCKHGLGPREEIQARRLRVIIENDDPDRVLRQRIEILYKNFGSKINGSFYDYIKGNDIVLYSAFERAGGILAMYNCLEEYGIF